MENDHKAELRRLRKELRGIEEQIAGAVVESERWFGLLREQGRLHWAISGELFWQRIEADRERELRQQREADSEGEGWKGGNDG